MGWWAAGYITRTANSSWSARGYVRANTGANGRQGTCLQGRSSREPSIIDSNRRPAPAAGEGLQIRLSLTRLDIVDGASSVPLGGLGPLRGPRLAGLRFTCSDSAPPQAQAVHDLPFDPMSEGNATLKEAFRHQAWATRELLAFCAQLGPEQLSQPRPAPWPESMGASWRRSTTQSARTAPTSVR